MQVMSSVGLVGDSDFVKISHLDFYWSIQVDYEVLRFWKYTQRMIPLCHRSIHWRFSG
jgi:hypothetical protein